MVTALTKLYEMGRSKRKALGLEAREWVLENFNEEKMVSDWDKLIAGQVDTYKQRGPQGVRLATF